jgi:AraC family transcriptional regulator
MSVSNRPAVVREYTRRLNLALDYIRDHLDGELTVESVSRAALFSPFHFHRLFGAMTGETLYNHIRRVRLEKAANLLLQSPCRPITDIALDVGFGSPSSFARAFRGHFGASATRWRADGGGRKSKKRKTNSKAGKAAAAASGYAAVRARYTPQPGRRAVKVELRDLPACRVAYVSSAAGYGRDAIHEAYETLMRWAGPRGLCGPGTKVIGASYDNPEITPLPRCRYDACIGIADDVRPDGPISVKTFPGGKYAVHRWRGRPQDAGRVFQRVMVEWFPSSGYQPGDAPCLEFYHGDPDLDPDGEATIEICIPVKPL